MDDHQPPVDDLIYLDVFPTRQSDGTIRVHVTDARCGLVLLSLTARDAAYLGGSLVSASARAGRVGHPLVGPDHPVHDEGDEDPPGVSWSPDGADDPNQ
ncbi:MAG: hypothetical protein GEV12_08595 [Micromonosporaceae bacterium]|nr:hypothetical protein [Micromonosporaceae bacterium]